ncbi:MAG: NADH:flavin oxidoreductase/NADH oxidase [Silicimonas sp.]|nr:NADH:flavin oxidoreductase/NADH oxidase [Silicimonas sp.]
MPSALFSPITLRDVTMRNRITVSPMCQYSAVEGVPQDWHFVHLGQFAMSGAGLIFTEATGVEPDGRITEECTGLYDDATEAAFARIVAFMKSVGDNIVGIQLSHAGRKGNTVPPWEGGGMIEGEGGWQPQAPSEVPYLPGWPEPDAMTDDDLARVKAAFVQAAKRADRAGFDIVQLHVAHGYLLHQFLSPITNTRNDVYGGSLEARMRYPLEVFEAVRSEFPSQKPVMVRLSATDWIDGGWDLDQSVEFCRALKDLDCDMVDVTSGGLDQRQKITTGPGYQVAMSDRIRREAGIATMSVGQITDPVQAETIVRTGQADMVAMARAMLWDPRWTWKAAMALDAEIALPAPYARCNPKLAATPFVTRK